VTGLAGHVVVERDPFRLDVAIEVGPGEVVALLGPNGAGKSTLLRAVCGLVSLTDGRIEVGGTVVDDAASGVFVDPSRRRIGVVFQDHRLFPHLSVVDNVAFGLRASGSGRAEARAAARAELDRLGLGSYADRRPATLSGGEAQRVALARALAARPTALLLDEPLAALDAATRLEVRDWLGAHLRDHAGPTLLVTHDPVDALVLADRVVVIEAGRVVQEGRADELGRRPATDYVARLLGINLLRGRADAGRVALAGGGELSVPDSGTSGPVLVAVRPAAIAVHTTRPAGSPRNVWSGVVDSVQSIGDRVRVTVAGRPSVQADLTEAAVAELGLRPGEAVWLSTKATELEVYPTA
jgi:molybdate transport system ATP-binding protein